MVPSSFCSLISMVLPLVLAMSMFLKYEFDELAQSSV